MMKKATDCLMSRVYCVNYKIKKPRVISAMFCKFPDNSRKHYYCHYCTPSVRLTVDGVWFTSHTDTTVNNMTDNEIASLNVYTTFEEAATEAGWISDKHIHFSNLCVKGLKRLHEICAHTTKKQFEKKCNMVEKFLTLELHKMMRDEILSDDNIDLHTDLLMHKIEEFREAVDEMFKQH